MKLIIIGILMIVAMQCVTADVITTCEEGTTGSNTLEDDLYCNCTGGTVTAFSILGDTSIDCQGHTVTIENCERMVVSEDGYNTEFKNCVFEIYSTNIYNSPELFAFYSGNHIFHNNTIRTLQYTPEMILNFDDGYSTGMNIQVSDNIFDIEGSEGIIYVSTANTDESTTKITGNRFNLDYLIYGTPFYFDKGVEYLNFSGNDIQYRVNHSEWEKIIYAPEWDEPVNIHDWIISHNTFNITMDYERYDGLSILYILGVEQSDNIQVFQNNFYVDVNASDFSAFTFWPNQINVSEVTQIGNYYNWFACTDSDLNGICENPYISLEENISYDYYPLAEPAPYIPCTPNWTCSSYGACNQSDLQPCNAVTDLNTCGDAYGGDYSEFTPQACDFCTPDWSCTGYGACNETDLQPCNTVTDLNTCGDAYGGDYSEFTPQACDFCTPSWSCSLLGECVQGDIKPCAAVVDANTCSESFTGNLSDYDGSCNYVSDSSNNGPFQFCTPEGECFESVQAYESSKAPTFFAGGNLQTENPIKRFFEWIRQLIWEGDEWP